jgi:prevent-host-death family protein
MDSYSLDDLGGRLPELVGKVEAGETVEITRGGKTIALVVPPKPPLKPIDWEALEQLRARLPWQEKPAAELIREMRDSKY